MRRQCVSKARAMPRQSAGKALLAMHRQRATRARATHRQRMSRTHATIQQGVGRPQAVPRPHCMVRPGTMQSLCRWAVASLVRRTTLIRRAMIRAFLWEPRTQVRPRMETVAHRQVTIPLLKMMGLVGNLHRRTEDDDGREQSAFITSEDR